MMLNKVINKSIEYLILFVIFAVPLYFAFFQENYNIFELNKLVLFRILVILIFLLSVLKVFINNKIELINDKIILLLILLFLASYSVSSILSIHPQLSFWGSYSRQQGLFSYVFYLIWFLLLLYNIKNFEFIKKIFIAILLSSFFVCVYGIMQYFGFDYLRWNENAEITGRIFSSLGQPNFLGHFIIMAIPPSLYSMFFIFKKFGSRLIIILIVLIQFLALLLTFSRSAWLGALVMIFLFIILILWRKKCKKTALLFLFVPVVTIGILINMSSTMAINNNSGKPTIKNRILSAVNFSKGSLRMRLEYWRSAAAEFQHTDLQKKIFGYGGETLYDVFVKYYSPLWGIYESVNSYPDRAHNSIFDTLLQFGLFGLLIQIILLVYVIFRLREVRWKNLDLEKYWGIVAVVLSLVGYMINNLFSFSLSVAFIYYHLFLAALLFLLRQDNSRIINFSFFKPISKAFVFLAALFLSFVYIFYYNLMPLFADYAYMEVKKAEKIGDCGSVIVNMEKVVDLNPLSTFYKEKYIFHNINCLDRISSAEDKKRLFDNVTKMIKLIDKKEYETSTYYVIAHAEASFGYLIDASRYAVAANYYEFLNKRNTTLSNSYYDQGRLYLWQKKYDQAINYANSGLEVLPDVKNRDLNFDHKEEIEKEMIGFYEILGEAYFMNADYSKARGYYEEILRLDPKYFKIYKKLADTYYVQGELEKAIFYNLRGLRLVPSDPAWPLALSILYKEKNDMVEADKYFAQYKKIILQNEK